MSDRGQLMASSDDADRQLNGRRAAHADTRRIGAERIAALVAVADAASMALLVVQEAATAAREDLDAVLRTVRAIDLQKQVAHDAASALDDAGARAAKHLRAVDRLTEAASRSVGAALAASGSDPARPSWRSSTPGLTRAVSSPRGCSSTFAAGGAWPRRWSPSPVERGGGPAPPAGDRTAGAG